MITIIGITLIPVAAFDAGGGQFALYNPDKVPANMHVRQHHQPEPGLLHHPGHPAAHPVRPRLPLHDRRARRPGHRHLVAAFVSDGSGGNVAEFDSVKDADWIGFTGPFHFGAPQFALVPILLMIVVMLITAVETTGDVYATGQIVEKPIGKSRHRRGPARRRARDLPRRRDELLPLHLLRRERRSGAADPGEEPVGGRHRRRHHDPARPDPQGRCPRLQHPAAASSAAPPW